MCCFVAYGYIAFLSIDECSNCLAKQVGVLLPNWEMCFFPSVERNREKQNLGICQSGMKKMEFKEPRDFK